MKRITKLFTPALLAAVFINADANAIAISTDTNKYWAEVKAFAPGEIPGVVSRSAAPAFSPDGKSVYFGTAPVKDITIMVSYYKDNKWTEPVIAPFSGGFHNLEPAFAPNGKYMVFASNRPATAGGKIFDGDWGKKNYPGNGGNPGFNSYDLDSRMRMVFYPAVIGWFLLGLWISTLHIRINLLRFKKENTF